VEHPRWRADLEHRRQRTARRVHAPEKQFEPNVQDPHLVAQCRASPDSLWIQHHNGIFRSTDAAASWSEIEDVMPSVFGFAVAVHLADADTAWFVPAVKDEKRYPSEGRVVVNRTAERLSRPSPADFRRSTPTISSSATPSKWMKPASGWRSALPPARCG